MDDDLSLNTELGRKRLRTSHACDVCRSRKIRCNGNTPCASCLASDTVCTYGSEANSRGKSDLILEGVLRMERSLAELNDRLISISTGDRIHSSILPLTPGPLTLGTSAASLCFSPGTDAHQPTQQRTPISDHHGSHNLENAVLESMHTSTTESVLQWHHFDAFPTLGQDYIPIFQLEQCRPAMRTGNAPVYLYTKPEDVEEILESFEHTINFWYPTMSRMQLQNTHALMTTMPTCNMDEEGVHVCLARLTMALGCASQVVSGLTGDELLTDAELRQRAGKRTIGDMYFDSAIRKIHQAHMEVSSTATHCLFYAALYFAFLRRPLQAWEYINAAAAKCQLLLSYPSSARSAEDSERISRIFWSCYILESDYVAELSLLPVSGIARIESSVPLPGEYHTHIIPQVEEHSSLYFLACISMRRLLNRVHQLLYAQSTGVSMDNSKFPQVVMELDHQLYEWRRVLPPAFSFTVGFDENGGIGGSTMTEHGGFLRQRYLACRSVIYRPYLMWVLSGTGLAGFGDGTVGGGTVSEDVLVNCKACLDACLLHILNLRGFSQTVLVDTWICSLSMAAAMLVLLAACRVPSLRSLIGPEVLAAGGHLRQVFEQWQATSGNPSSPSVDQSVRMIGDVELFIRQVYLPGESYEHHTDSHIIA